MRKRKGSRSASSSSSSTVQEEAEEPLQQQQNDEGSEGQGFFACYLLASLNPRFKGHTYIGFTVNPRRRIRQHNGEIGCGAWRTKKKRPWEMVLCIYGFPTNVSALQFEWAWQHPVESLAVRKAAGSFKSLSGVANKIKLAYTMLTLPSWQNMNITVNFFSTMYMKHCAGCPSLPEHMKVEIGSMDELPCYTERIGGLSENEDDAIDEVEFDNCTSNSNPVPDACGDSITRDSDTNHGDTISESFARNQESEARDPISHSLGSQESLGSITSPMLKSSPAKGVGIIEETDFASEMDKSGAGLSQPEFEQSGAVLASTKNQQVNNNTFVVPHEAEIIDLSTPSPSCRNILDRNKKRRASSCVGADFIDLTKSPNFIQL